MMLSARGDRRRRREWSRRLTSIGPAHQRIFEAILAIYARGEPVDAITTVEELKRRDALDEVGGALAVYNLVESVPTPASRRRTTRGSSPTTRCSAG